MQHRTVQHNSSMSISNSDSASSVLCKINGLLCSNVNKVWLIICSSWLFGASRGKSRIEDNSFLKGNLHHVWHDAGFEPNMQGTHGSNADPKLIPNAKGSVEADNTIYYLAKLNKNTAGFTNYTKQPVLSVFGRICRPAYLARVFQS